jgi:hypothetical protein
MPKPDDCCPPPRQCIDWLLAIAEELPASRRDGQVRLFETWLRGVRDHDDGVQVLESARRVGADLPRLLLAAGIYLGIREWLDGPLANFRIGPVSLAGARVRDIDELLANAMEAEEALGRPSADAAEFRAIKNMLEPLEEEVRRHGGQVRTVLVPDGAGGWREQRMVLKGAAAVTTTGEMGPGPAALRRPRGDAALDVLLVLVSGHLHAVTGERRALLAAGVLATGLKIGVADAGGGPADAVAAMRQRIYRCFEAKRNEVQERADFVARALSLPIRLD